MSIGECRESIWISRYAKNRINDNTSTGLVKLLYNRDKGGRICYKRVLVVQSICAFFEFYKHDIWGQRIRLLTGPCRSYHEKVSSYLLNKKYVLSGNNNHYKSKYVISVKKIKDNSVLLTLRLIAPNQVCDLTLEILKLYRDLFKGGQVVTYPQTYQDIQFLPSRTRDDYKGTLLVSDKNLVIFSTEFISLEIKDLLGNESINVADFGNVKGDKKRSFFIFTKVKNVKNSAVLLRKYLITFREGSGSVNVKHNKDETTHFGNSKDLFLIPPKLYKKKKGLFKVDSKVVVYINPKLSLTSFFFKAIYTATKIKLNLKTVTHPNYELSKLRKPFILFRQTNLNKTGNDKFSIKIDQDKIVVLGSNLRSLVYGAYVLISMLKRVKTSWGIPCCEIIDWPDVKIRGQCIECSPPGIHSIRLFERYIDALARARINTILFYNAPKQVLGLKGKGNRRFWTSRELEKIANYARSLGIEIWTGMICKFNHEAFPEITQKGTNFYDPCNSLSYKVLFGLYDTLLKIFYPRRFLIGHDEIKGLEKYAHIHNIDPAELFATDVNKICRWLMTRNIDTIIWGDMLLDCKKWGREIGYANSKNPVYRSGDTAEAINKLSKNIKIFDWHYDLKSEYRSIRFFRQKGFTVYGCYWNNKEASEMMARSVKKYRGEGVFGTDWGFWRTLSPASTTLCGAMFGWSSSYKTPKKDLDVWGLASVLWSDFIPKYNIQEPIMLRNYCNETTFDKSYADNKGIFAVGPLLDLRNLRTGLRILGGIKFILFEANGGATNNCIVVSNSKNRNIEIKFKPLRANAIAFLHTCYIEEPSYSLKTVGKYIIEYEGGSRTSVDLKEGWNITDVRSSVGLRYNAWNLTRAPDILLGAKLVWRGFSKTGIPLNLQVYLWKNKYPKKKIMRILICPKPTKEMTRIALLAITALN